MTPDIPNHAAGHATEPAAAPEHALSDHAALFALLDRWVDRGWLRSLDRAFAAFLHREASRENAANGISEASPLLLLAAALASHQLGRGHVCLDLAQTLATPDLALSLPPEGDSLDDPPPLPSRVMAALDLDAWRAALDQPELVADGPGSTPLVLAGSAARPRLYLRRYWQHEQDIHSRIFARLGGTDNDEAPDAARLRPILDALFPERGDAPPAIDWQKAACALAGRSRFAVITGGPGTGKTTTVVRLLALLQALAMGNHDDQESEEDGAPPLRIRLAAPTGKAAARLNESIAGQVARLDLDGLADDPERLREVIPKDVSTLHRLLGSRPDTRRFRHDRHNPLPLDVLVVDEASMVDVGMMAAMLEALPPRARLVLLGDKDQLASVEAGSVLGDLCARAEGGHYTSATADWLAQATGQPLPAETRDADGQPLDQAIAMLRVSHRFTADSGIGQLAAAINLEAEPAAKRSAITNALTKNFADLSHQKLRADDERGLARLAVIGCPERFPKAGQGRMDRDEALPPPVGYRHFLSVMAGRRPADDADQQAFDDWARAVLAAHGDFQLLCALRRGPWGVEGLNERVRQALEREKLIDSQDGRQRWYPGRPVLVTKNDYGLGLMNGDIGITLDMPRPGTTSGDNSRRLLRVAFPAGDGTDRIKWVLPSRLQSVETVFAMTVHKSQGSEFTHAALVLPDAPNPILTRELVYTGITRARHWLTLVETGRGQLMDAAQRRVMRVSGLGG
ncbi:MULTISPECIES: exodeoxyribonuclease V subunit alpha [Halomonas]|uniref:RecBCD enzyme subunit RecD n=1 Tax=Halomonas halophila TaxID=29573 RepID=A0ABQ0U0S0_9GAMM|nr:MULTISPECIES: exodeoxyribonuclease V subunit alpha [Halomonas]MDR5888641.1 exodeoxyribonuclease V subunit alpha [Halomonas salina]WJY07822.1 exodeoxyribonuclease V subunit alpha [Halomonas halophila]GEK71997.1 RecBCD enzyme subunit RecD [Halomonas halophila]